MDEKIQRILTCEFFEKFLYAAMRLFGTDEFSDIFGKASYYCETTRETNEFSFRNSKSKMAKTLERDFWNFSLRNSPGSQNFNFER
jgi:hypothetical protein